MHMYIRRTEEVGTTGMALRLVYWTATNQMANQVPVTETGSQANSKRVTKLFGFDSANFIASANI